MRKIMNWVLAATLICGASVFTSCSSNEDSPSPVEQSKKDRKEFISHVRSDLKGLAEDLTFKAWPNLNGFLINFNNQVLLNDNYKHELALLFNQKIMQSLQPVEEGSDLQKLGFKYQATVDLTDFNYRFTAEAGTNFKVEPAEDFEIVFYNAETDVHVNILFKASGSSANVLSPALSALTQNQVAVMLLAPEKFDFELCNDKDGTMRPWLTGEFTNTLKKTAERSFYDITQDEWMATGTTVTGHGGETLDFTIMQDPVNHKAYNEFNILRKGRNMLELALEITDLDGKPDYTQMSLGDNFFDLITNVISGYRVDNLSITTLENITTTMKISDCQKFVTLHAQMTKARRSGADQKTIDGYASQMNDLLTCSVNDKLLGQTIPMRFMATKVGVDWWAMPAMSFADENGFVPITDLLDKESMEYAVNIIDHAAMPMQQDILIARQLTIFVMKLMGMVPKTTN